MEKRCTDSPADAPCIATTSRHSCSMSLLRAHAHAAPPRACFLGIPKAAREQSHAAKLPKHNERVYPIRRRHMHGAMHGGEARTRTESVCTTSLCTKSVASMIASTAICV